MSGFVGDLSPQQTAVLEKFRQNVKDVLKPKQGDYYLLRWLRARDFDEKKAEKMLRDALQWRQEMGADTILEDYQPIEVLEKYRTGGILGRDKSGCPIYIDPYGLIDMKGLLRSVKKQDILKKFVQVMESVGKICEEESKKNGCQLDTMTIIYDLKGLGLKHMSKESVDMYLAIVDASESRYPEVLRRAFVINSPKIFPIIWSIVRPFLHENTANKVVVLSGNYKEALLKEISPDQLPACYGGTLTDPDGDPRCKTYICQGGTVPKECYSQAVPHHAMLTGNIGRGSTLQLEYEVHEPNSILRYEFQTDGYDIGFGVFRKNSKERLKASEMDTILSTQRSNCHLVPEDGAVECDSPGIYVVRFDNTYSWARSKKVYYVIEVLETESKSNMEVSNDDDDNDDDDDEFVMAQDTAF
ncbi:SEC14-like protein 2 isoform X1 [Mercenaria mercenaria]|uniref:SEC14-like protein 2 isoform X1 n=1 Tax=Mercenaria mercenaria TaxID=6596 RepID=UPI00234E89B7|nr:SEC14-like protein 2 isoform X1 [Mercenaria mercenaria]